MPSLDLGSVVGPQGEQGATGAQGIRGEQGLPGPNQVTNSTATPLTGVLTGNGSVVGVESIDAAPTADSTGFARSGGTYNAIKARVPVYGLGKNLLDNWYFGNPVNQRGESSYSAPGGRNYYTIDRWFVYSAGAAVSVGSGSVTVGPRSDGASSMTENLDIPFSDVAGKSMSVSCLLADGSFITASNTLPATTPSSNTSLVSAYGPSGSSGYFARLGYNNRFYFTLQTPANSSLQIVAVKLELGTEQTLCHNEGTAEAPVWVLNEVPDYEYELYRCMTSTADSSDTYANKTLATEKELAYVENGTTASRAYAVGEYFCRNGQTCRAKTAIAQGATLTLNTNYEAPAGGGLNAIAPTRLLSEVVTEAGNYSVPTIRAYNMYIVSVVGNDLNFKTLVVPPNVSTQIDVDASASIYVHVTMVIDLINNRVSVTSFNKESWNQAGLKVWGVSLPL